jgi:hypothetical protein
MTNAMILDFYGTAVSKNGLDTLIDSYTARTAEGKIDYDRGGSTILGQINRANQELIAETKSIFFPGVKALYDRATDSDLEVRVYSNGHGAFIDKAFELQGMNVRFLDPSIVGDKKQAESYRTIRTKEGYDIIIFATDSQEEVDAAIGGEIDKALLIDADNPDYSSVEEAIDETDQENESDGLESEGDADATEA